MAIYHLLFSEATERKLTRGKMLGADPNSGLCVYLGSDGEPVVVTQVSQDIPPYNAFQPDLKCVDTLEDPVCIVATTKLLTTGQDFCRSRNIPETLDGLLAYMDQQSRMPIVRTPFRVGRPLQLKR